jgi:hypothetical protein
MTGGGGMHAWWSREDRLAESCAEHSRTNQSSRRDSRLLCGCIACLALVLLLLDLVFSQNDRMSFDGNTSSPPSIGGLGRQ